MLLQSGLQQRKSVISVQLLPTGAVSFVRSSSPLPPFFEDLHLVHLLVRRFHRRSPHRFGDHPSSALRPRSKCHSTTSHYRFGVSHSTSSPSFLSPSFFSLISPLLFADCSSSAQPTWPSSPRTWWRSSPSFSSTSTSSFRESSKRRKERAF